MQTYSRHETVLPKCKASHVNLCQSNIWATEGIKCDQQFSLFVCLPEVEPQYVASVGVGVCEAQRFIITARLSCQTQC